IWKYGALDDDSAPDRTTSSKLSGRAIAVAPADPVDSNGAPTTDRFSEALGATRTLAWFADEVRDRYGNYFRIVYDRTTDSTLPGAVEVVPRLIVWTGHDGPPVLGPTRSIELKYVQNADGSRARKTDTRTSYRGGLAVRQSALLDKIIVSGPDRLVSDGPSAGGDFTEFREYRFSYLPQQQGHRPVDRLASIVECVR